MRLEGDDLAHGPGSLAMATHTGERSAGQRVTIGEIRSEAARGDCRVEGGGRVPGEQAGPGEHQPTGHLPGLGRDQPGGQGGGLGEAVDVSEQVSLPHHDVVGHFPSIGPHRLDLSVRGK
ncbi:hypothetical protein [Actinoplanes sp. M2I2]|uniref:hypothetical protein n=1 Tax=Actinoplanes sp. M2I2 TaxID=1734444 RepID=UPI0020228FB3|nr:hypothetical protein [Actinoplanes sp. M2I2]